MSEARLRCAAQILDKIENMWTYYYEEPLKVSMAWEKFLIFLTMCPLQADWNSSACVRVCVRAGERVCARVCVSYLNDLFWKTGLQPLEVFPVGNQELKHVTRNLGHCLVPKLCTQRRGGDGHSTRQLTH